MYISQEKVIWKIAQAAAEYNANREDEARCRLVGDKGIADYFGEKAKKSLYFLEQIADLITSNNEDQKATARDFITLEKKAARRCTPYSKKLDMFAAYITAKQYPRDTYELEKKLKENAARQIKKAQQAIEALKAWRVIER